MRGGWGRCPGLRHCFSPPSRPSVCGGCSPHSSGLVWTLLHLGEGCPWLSLACPGPWQLPATPRPRRPSACPPALAETAGAAPSPARYTCQSAARRLGLCFMPRFGSAARASCDTHPRLSDLPFWKAPALKRQRGRNAGMRPGGGAPRELEMGPASGGDVAPGFSRGGPSAPPSGLSADQFRHPLFLFIVIKTRITVLLIPPAPEGRRYHLHFTKEKRGSGRSLAQGRLARWR